MSALGSLQLLPIVVADPVGSALIRPGSFPFATCPACPSNPSPMELPGQPPRPLDSNPAANPFAVSPSMRLLSFAHSCLRLRPWLSATQYSRCLMCGAATPAAHRSAAPTAYPNASRSVRTPARHNRPSDEATCSPKTVAGRHSSMSRKNSGHRCLSSASPSRLPLTLKGWHGHEPGQTGRLAGHAARLSASDHPPIPAKKWHCVYPSISLPLTSEIDRSSTSPGGNRPPAIKLRSHRAAPLSHSL